MLLTPAHIKPKLFESRRNSLFLTRGGYVSCLRAHLGTRLLPVLLVLKPFRGHWPREDKECPFSGVTKSSRVWRKVPESDAWSVCVCVCVSVYVCGFAFRCFKKKALRFWALRFYLWCTYGRVYVPCIYMHAKWELPQVIQVFVAVLVWHLSFFSYLIIIIMLYVNYSDRTMLYVCTEYCV